jgi:hypothetical protein
MEFKMSAKIIPVIAAGLLLATTALASAQTKTFARDLYTPVLDRGGPYYSGYSGYYGSDPYYGTPYENVAPYSADRMPDPYMGTVYDGVAPY